MTTRNDTAVVQCVTASHLPFALYLAWQVCMHCPDRSFDVVIVSPDEIVLPKAFAALGILVLRFDPGAASADLPLTRLPVIAYQRLFLPGVLGKRYRRLLYLDCDMHFEGGDLSRLMELPIGDRTVAMVRNIRQFFDPNFLVDEFRILGLGPRTYYNSGIILIDTQRYNDRDCLPRALDVAVRHPEAVTAEDQSVLNIALKDEIAELSPMWNWQLNLAHRVLAVGLPVRFRHFVGKAKPWSDPTGMQDLRFHEAYTQFFRAYLPQAIGLVEARPGPRGPDLKSTVQLAALQFRLGGKFAAYYGRFADEWDVKA